MVLLLGLLLVPPLLLCASISINFLVESILPEGILCGCCLAVLLLK